jgi:hypothetical protein
LPGRNFDHLHMAWTETTYISLRFIVSPYILHNEREHFTRIGIKKKTYRRKRRLKVDVLLVRVLLNKNHSLRLTANSLLYLLDINPLNAELNPICHLLALLGVHHFLHASRIRVKSLTIRLLMSYIYDISSLRVKFRVKRYLSLFLLCSGYFVFARTSFLRPSEKQLLNC